MNQKHIVMRHLSVINTHFYRCDIITIIIVLKNRNHKIGGWTGWGSGAKRNGGDPPHRTIIIYLATLIQNIHRLLIYIYIAN
jgi:hypothetical protein